MENPLLLLSGMGLYQRSLDQVGARTSWGIDWLDQCEELEIAGRAADRRRGEVAEPESLRRKPARQIFEDAPMHDRIADYPARSDIGPPRFELRLHQRNDRRARHKDTKEGRQYQAKRDEGYVNGGQVWLLGKLGQITGVQAIERDDAGVGSQAPVELTTSDVDRVDSPDAPLQQHIGESTGRGANVYRDQPRYVEGEAIERVGQFVAAAADIRFRLAYLQDRLDSNLLPGLLRRLTVDGDLAGQNERLRPPASFGQTPFDERNVESRSQHAVRNLSTHAGGSGPAAGVAWLALRTRSGGPALG